MVKNLSIFFFTAVFLSATAFGQEGFRIQGNKTKGKVNFELTNNLILMPVEVNGIKLTFLLDSGAANTVIFSFEERDSLFLNDSRKILLRGLSSEEPVEAIKSDNNILQIGNAVKNNQTIYVVFDGSLRLSARLGVPVHGIIGYDFLSDFVVEINYVNESIRFHDPKFYKQKRCKNCIERPLSFSKNKPYIEAEITNASAKKKVKLLIDSGSSDALWLFEDKTDSIQAPDCAFHDYLGVSINGNIYGKRAMVPDFWIDEFHLQRVNVAYPDLSSFTELNLFEGRNGSLGGDLLKRFHVIFDYRNETIVLAKNRKFKQPFYYNMSGLTLEQGSLMVARKKVNKSGHTEFSDNQNLSSGYTISNVESFQFSLERLFVVADVRENSPAAQAGIKVGDEISEINGKPVYNYKLYEVNELFYTKRKKTIRMKTIRNGVTRNVRFLQHKYDHYLIKNTDICVKFHTSF